VSDQGLPAILALLVRLRRDRGSWRFASVSAACRPASSERACASSASRASFAAGSTGTGFAVALGRGFRARRPAALERELLVEAALVLGVG